MIFENVRGVFQMFERISVRKDINHGQACVTGTRVPVYQVVRMLAAGDTVELLLREYPNLEHEDILACLDYASFVVENQKVPDIREWVNSLEMADAAG